MKQNKEKNIAFKALRKKAKKILNKTKNPTSSKKSLPKKSHKLFHELQTRQLELEIQNDELQKALFNMEESQKRYLELYNFTPIGYLTLSKNNTMIDINDTGSKLLGLEKNKLFNKSFSSFVAKEHQGFFKKYYQLATNKKKQAFEIKLLRKNFGFFYAHIEIISTKCLETNDRLLRLSIIDISNLKKAIDELHRSEEKYRFFIENTKKWIWVTNLDGCFTYSNPSVKIILGYLPSELMGNNCSILAFENDFPIANKFFSGQIKHEKIDYILRLHHKDGSIRYIESKSTPIIDRNGKVQGFRGTSRDITLRKQGEDQRNLHRDALNQASRLSYLGELASGLAHELTQPLTAIINFSSGCVKRLGSDNCHPQDFLDILKKIVSQAERAGRIIHSMKDFVKKGKLHYESLDLYELIRDAISSIDELLIQNAVEINIQIIPSALILTADRIQISLVILNLIRNGIEAMADIKNFQKKIITIYGSQINEDSIKIVVHDTGPGFNKELDGQLFDSWITSKPTGLGLGLSISRSIIEAHGGQLHIKSTDSAGTCLEFILPINREILKNEYT